MPDPHVTHGLVQVREWLEKNYTATSGADTVKQAIKALTETVEAGSKNMEIAVVEKDTGLRFLADEEVDRLVAEIDADKAAAEAARRASTAGGATGSS